MKTITVREANNRIAKFRGTQGLVIKELILGDPKATDYFDREVVVPCGFTGALSLNVKDCSVNLGGVTRPGCKKDDGGAYLDGLILDVSIDNGMLFAARVRDSFITPTIRDSKLAHGGMAKDCRGLVVRSGSVQNIGDPTPEVTGQSYAWEFNNCVDCIAEGIDVQGVRYGVVFAGSGSSNKALNITGSPGIAHVDFHNGVHQSPLVAGAGIVKDGNETWGGGSVDGQFYGVESYRRVQKQLSGISG